jgi:hypothetical protein
VPPILRIKVATLPINPVLSKPAPIIMTAIIDITAFEENPSNNLWLSQDREINYIQRFVKISKEVVNVP